MKKKILFISHTSNLHGSETILSNIIKSLNDQFSVYLIVPKPGLLVDKLLAVRGITIHYLPLPIFSLRPWKLINFFSWLLPFSFFLLRKIRSIKPDIIYCNTICSYVPVILADFMKCRTIWHIHERNKKKIMGQVYAFIALKFPHRIVFISEFVKQTFVSYYPKIADKSEVVYNGIDQGLLESNMFEPIELKQINGQFPVLASVAQLVPHKRLHDLIFAMRSLVKDYPTAKLLLIGDGILHSKLEKMIMQHKLQQNVFLLGYISQAGRVLSQVDIFLCPFKDEGFGLVAIEAMAMKKPVIAADSGGLLEIIKDGESGLLYPVGDVTCLVGKIKMLINSDSLRREVGLSGYKRVRESFSLEKQTRLVKNIIDEMFVS